MTDEQVAESTEENESKAKGRPRPAATVELDAKVLGVIAAATTGITRDQLAEQTGEAANKVYLSLYRLRVQKEIHKVRDGRTTKWYAGAPTETPAELTEAPPANPVEG